MKWLNRHWIGMEMEKGDENIIEMCVKIRLKKKSNKLTEARNPV